MDKDKGRKQNGSEKDDDDAAAKEIKVSDRRRIRLNNNGHSDSGADEAPSLKPTYIEELEARTKAAEQKIMDVQARFEELQARLQSEADETRQRLNRAA